MNTRKYFGLAQRMLVVLSLSIGAFGAVPGFAMPDQGSYATANEDTATINVDGTNMGIVGKFDNNVLNWQSFNIQSNEAVNFDNKNYLNIVNGSSISQIYGKMSGEGNIYLINPNGVIFGPNCSVNVGNLFVSTRVMNKEGIDAFEKGGSPLSGAFQYDPSSVIEIVNTEKTIKADKLTLEGGKISLRNETANIEKLNVEIKGTPISLERNLEEAMSVAKDVAEKEKHLPDNSLDYAGPIYEEEYNLYLPVMNVKSGITEILSKLGECISEDKQKEDLKELEQKIFSLKDRKIISLHRKILEILRHHSGEFNSQVLEEIIKQVKEFEAERYTIIQVSPSKKGIKVWEEPEPVEAPVYTKSPNVP